MKKLILSFVLAFVASAAHAGTSTGVVYATAPMGNGVVLFYSSGTSAGQPPCPGLVAGRFAVDTNTQAGRSQATQLSVAESLGKLVTFVGTGACTLWTDTETLNHAVIYW